ncbi:ABC transporter ATP-binding protein [Drancourtella massiliensis]|uniref:ABC transporter ATP-binding protein n=1 Tax=Drancourtella massiliensis TaxID=1632013 RepID=A0ABS2ED77_9FIRM|nr:ABC transporter ATP-binding protein [Drancourtella massiliensis]MBM6742940.1 ABC transporter ATP-binding protein [Drancourtella massiliensis]
MKTLLQVKELAVSYFTYAGEVQAVRGVSFDVEKNQTVAIVGESGCGKTVTAKSIMGLIKKPGIVDENSQILFQGENLVRYTKKQWNNFCGKECGMIFQDALVSLNPTMKVGKQIIENLDNHEPSLSKEEKKARAVEILKLAGIADAEQCLEKYPHELSGGMRQRVMIGMALVTNPKLLIADEPTTALDVTIQAQIMELLKDLQNKLHMSIILITHDLGVVADIADFIVVMYAGKIVERGSCREIFYHASHPYTWALLKSVPRIDYNGQTLVTIEGSIPDMTNPPKGCAFCKRCPYAMHICKEHEPSKWDLGDGHEVSCWLMDERADREGVPFETGRRVGNE